MRFEYKRLPIEILHLEIKRLSFTKYEDCVRCEKERKKYLNFLKSDLRDRMAPKKSRPKPKPSKKRGY